MSHNHHERLTSSATTPMGILQKDRQLTLPTGDMIIVGLPQRLRRDHLFGGEELTIPGHPHVFFVHELILGKSQLLTDVIVLAAHGTRRSEDNEWVFRNGTKVVSTVLAYNELAESVGLPKIQAVLVCNGSTDEFEAVGTTELQRQGVIFPLYGNVLAHINLAGKRVKVLAAVSNGGSFFNSSIVQ